jgi:hypothetical protein
MHVITDDRFFNTQMLHLLELLAIAKDDVATVLVYDFIRSDYRLDSLTSRLHQRHRISDSLSLERICQ